MQPAIMGTKGILESISKVAPSVKRVVIVSSFASVVDYSKGNAPEYAYSDKDWNPVSLKHGEIGLSGTDFPCIADHLRSRLRERCKRVHRVQEARRRGRMGVHEDGEASLCTDDVVPSHGIGYSRLARRKTSLLTHIR